MPAQILPQLVALIIQAQRMKLDIKSAWTICPSTIHFVLPFSTFDLPYKILFLPKSMRTRMNVYRKIATQRAKPGYEVSTWLYC